MISKMISIKPAGLASRPTASRAVVRSQAQPTNKKVPKPARELMLNSSIAPVLALAALNPMKAMLQPQADFFSTLGLPEALVHWGHPGNMAVVLFAMGGYGAGYLGWQIRTSEDPDMIVKAKELHPKLAVGMGVFFLLGGLGGMMSMLMQGKDIMSSPHFVTGSLGLVALALQGMLPLFFADDPNARGLHAYFGTGVLGLFLVHAGLGLKLGLSL